MNEIDFQLSDGRNIHLLVGEQFDGPTVIFHHGTPAYAGTWRKTIAQLESEGISAIAYSRAGYFTSDRKMGRRVIDVLDDLGEVLDQYRVESFVSVGWSGGGPHTLASGLDPRCTAVFVLAGVGMFGQSDLDFLVGMGQDNLEEFGAAVAGLDKLEEWMSLNGPGIKEVTAEQLQATQGNLFSKKDRQILTNFEDAQELAECFRNSVKISYAGWIDDDIAFTNEWGFSLDEITVPVHLIQGDEDLMVPPEHAAWLLKHLPQASLAKLPGWGHLGLIDAAINQILKEIA